MPPEKPGPRRRERHFHNGRADTVLRLVIGPTRAELHARVGRDAPAHTPATDADAASASPSIDANRNRLRIAIFLSAFDVMNPTSMTQWNNGDPAVAASRALFPFPRTGS
ncbi:MAG TPA: hypothetical protein VMA86_01985 [Acetobacteraceae bacterium]|nr:hypothetical protein [Acetobacteraceae bacterium]